MLKGIGGKDFVSSDRRLPEKAREKGSGKHYGTM